VTKNDLVRAVYERHGGLSRDEASEIVERILERMRCGLKRGERVQINGFGRLEVVTRRARAGRNPRTGQDIEIPARTTVVLRPSSAFVDRLKPDDTP